MSMVTKHSREDVVKQLETLLRGMLAGVLDNTGSATVRAGGGESIIVFTLACTPQEFGRIIGKEGRTIDAIRRLMYASASKFRYQVILEVLDPGSLA